MPSNCDPLTITYVASGFSIVGGIIGAYTGHILTKSRDSINSKNATLDKWISIVSGEIQRINGESYSTTGTIGDIATIKSLLSTISATNPEICLSSKWEEYNANEHRRRYQEPKKKINAINALKSMIHILQSYKL